MDRIAKIQIPAVKAKLLDGKRGLIVALPTKTRSPGVAPKPFGRSGPSSRLPI
jgi:hypothetical protein